MKVEISVKQQIIKSEITSIIIRQTPVIILIQILVKHNISGRTPNSGDADLQVQIPG